MRGVWLSDFHQSTHNECSAAPFKCHSGGQKKLQQNWLNNLILIQQYSCSKFAINILKIFR